MNKDRRYCDIDKLLIETDKMLRALGPNTRTPKTPSPAKDIDETHLSQKKRKHAAGLMRINHTGEVCAQALYQGQALTAKLPGVREKMEASADEEIDHLVWCDQRLQQLESRRSYLNPVLYGVSFGLGALAGAISDRVSLGFVAATEELVSGHLEDHLQKLPKEDKKSRSIVSQMLADENRHRQVALDAGGKPFPTAVKIGMKLMAKVMTKTSYRI
ncbi:MAG: ubiquinone biosynthesis monooxygenase Coq7 [Cellvibrionaceae bacterium]|jgi:ubiquinone biosynthesis monooxygenase Coq7